MTVLSSPPETDAAAVWKPPTDGSPADKTTDSPSERPPSDPAFAIPGAALLIFAALLLGFVANLTVVGHLQHARAQQIGYADLRKQLAEGVAPVGQTDVNGKLLTPGDPVAILRAPAIGLREVVLEGTTSSVLTGGPGHSRKSALPGQPGTSVIMGRQWGYGSPFQAIDQLKPGNRIEVTTGQGKHTYEVIGVRRAGDPVPVAKQGQGLLTLVTATGSPYTPSGVLRVDAELTSDVQQRPSRVLGPGQMSKAEEALEGDNSAWLLILLWSQLLLVVAGAVTWLYRRWGHWQTWIVGLPVLTAVGIALSGAVTRLLPNLL
ncbi:class E sortase [Streptomyces formicae]|uniref:Class E sortase n=1 Tax=Streptomyces formicae TaxID=1616117 RepID=A0ABY3WED5_9ACTN|nr:class E sortase [Streptomyces formicae]UNM10936.1 class E sortase [Streptomyces formicae]